MSKKENARSIVGKVSLALVLAMVLSVFASAAMAETLFTYSGTGIWTKESANTAYVSGSTCSVNHNQTRNNKGTGRQMTVYIQRKDGLGWTDTASRTFYNENGGVFSSYCSAGTYRLYFYSGFAHSKFDIYGSFYR